MRSTLFALLAVSAAAIYACGGETPPPNTPPSSGGDAGAVVSPNVPADAGAGTPQPSADADAGSSTGKPNVPTTEAPSFDSMTKEQKVDTMMTKVVPNVGKEFKEFDGKRYAKFGCQTCHGPQKKDDPHDVLPKLTLSNGGFEKLQKAKPALVKFMAEKVTPTMAAALNEKPMDPATHKGFGCGGCHKVN